MSLGQGQVVVYVACFKELFWHLYEWIEVNQENFRIVDPCSIFQLDTACIQIGLIEAKL
jgi:hypothetical protein